MENIVYRFSYHHSMLHDLNLVKIEAYGLDRNSLNLLSYYSRCLKQRVKVGSAHSSWFDIRRGVPQRSILQGCHKKWKTKFPDFSMTNQQNSLAIRNFIHRVALISKSEIQGKFKDIFNTLKTLILRFLVAQLKHVNIEEISCQVTLVTPALEHGQLTSCKKLCRNLKLK